MSDDVEEHCYKCGASHSLLTAQGRVLYVCDLCGKDCCSSRSHDGPGGGIEVLCDDCENGDGP